MSKRVRHPVSGAEQAPTTSTMRLRTRLRYSHADMVVLECLAKHFDHIQSKDLAARCKAGKDHDKAIWATRKQVLTAECSSRWAGWITKSSNDAYGLAQRNEARALVEKNKAIAAITKKLALPVHSAAERKAITTRESDAAKAENRHPHHLDFGYRSAHEHAMKRQRLQHLKSQAETLQRDIDTGRVHVTRGGKKLLGNRLHLDKAGITEDEWQARWHAKRWSFAAFGEAGKRYGNETIRVSPDGTLEVDLPETLASLANVTVRGLTRYRFDARVSFSYRQDDWLTQIEANRAVAYDVMFDPSGRVYLDASFTPAESLAVPKLEELFAMPDLRVLSLDLNNGFLAPAVVDRSGNPIKRLDHIPFVTENLPASQRDGHLRQALTDALDLAQLHGCKAVVVENLGFSEMRATGRERYGSRKWFRKIVCGIPTAQVRDRLVAMASRRGIAVLGVPAAYSSIWGAEYWQAPLSSGHHKVSGHTAAAVVLGRRALGHSARRRSWLSPGVTAPDRRIEAAVVSEDTCSTAGAESYHVSTSGFPGTCHHATQQPRRRKGNPEREITSVRDDLSRERKTRNGKAEMREARPAKTVRAGPSDTDQLRLIDADV